MGPTPLLPTPAKDIVPKGAPIFDMIVWFLLFTANIQNKRENLGMMTTTMVLFTFLIPLLLRISIMRELDQILFLRETSPSRLMRELLYPLPQILDDGPVVRLASILLLGGFEEQMEEWSMSISVSLGMKAMGKLNREIFALTLGSKQIPPYANTMSKKKKALKNHQYQRSLQSRGDRALQLMLIEDSLPSISDLINSHLSKYITLAANDCGYDGTAEELIVQYVHPLFLRAHSAASKEDNPGWQEAKQGKFADDYWKAMEVEIFTLESIDAWEVVDCVDDMNVINSTWAFKCKRYPDGLIKKFKARFCARGVQQLEGIDFFEIYAPVVQWTTIRLMFVLEVLLGLKLLQGNVPVLFCTQILRRTRRYTLICQWALLSMARMERRRASS
jgi:hypothetical protein